MSQLASLISKFDSSASGQSSPHYHHHQPHHSYHHQQSKSSSQHQQSSTTYHQLTSTELTTSGVHTNSSAMSSNTTTPSTIAALTAAATTSSNIHYQHHINAQATHHESTSNHSYNLANSSASKFSNFNHTLTDSSTTGGTTTGTSTKSTNLFSLPVAVNASGVMNGGVYLAASSTTGLVSSGIAGTPMSATTTTTFQISSTDKDNSVSAAICNESGKLAGNNKNSNYHHQKASRNGKYSSSKQTAQHQQQHQTNSDHSLEKSSNTQTQTPQTSNNQTHSNTKFSDQYQSYSPITPIIDYSNNNSDIFSDYSIEAMNSTSVNVNHHHNNVHSHQKQQPVTVISSQQQQPLVSRTATTTPPQENSVTYKSIMIIDVINKQQPSKVATNNHSQMVRRCRDELKLDVVHHRHHNHLSEDDDDDDASVYINEIKFYNDIDHPVIVTNQQKSGGGRKVRNKIERNINNFYLLNNNNSTTTGNSNRNDDAKNKINYVFDEEKIASYDITPLKLRNCMFVASGVDSIDPQAICPGIVDVGHLEHLGRSKKATMANSVGGGNSNKKSGQFVLNQKRMRRKLFKENIFHINNRKASLRKPLNYLRQNHIYCRNNEHKRYEFINTTDMDSMISSVSFNDYQFALDCMNTSDSSRSSSPHPKQLKDSVVAASAPSVVVEANLVTNSKSTPLCCRQETYHNCKSGSKNNLKSMVNGVKKNSGGKITWLRKSNKNLSNNRAMYNEEISGSQSRLLKTKPKKSRANISNGESSENGSTSNSSTSSESSESSNSSSHSSNGDVIVPGIMNSAVIVMTAAPLTAIPSSEAAAVLMMNKKKQASEGSSDDNEDDEEEMDYNNSKPPGPISIGTDLQVNQQQQNHSCAVDLTPNFYQNGGNFDEADEPASNEYARADDDILAANKDTIVDDKDLYDGCCDGASRVGAGGGISANRDLLNNAASDEEFTYSYGDVLSTAAAAITPASKLADEVKLETAEAIVGTKPTPTLATNNSIVAIATTENALVKPSSIVVNYDVLNLNIHRLPGETLGMNLKLGDDGRVVVAHVIENGAAERASDSIGNRCPVKIRDEIVEINGVSLSNVKNEDILSLLEELPLFITLKLKRSIQQDQDQTARLLSPTASPAENINESSSSGRTSPNIINDKIPIGYNLHTIYLSSLESKCIMPNDLKDCSDAEGLYRIQRSTLQIGGEEDHLRKGDVLFNINGEELAYKNKFELVSKLSSLEGIAEVSVLRKISPNCFGSNNPEQQVPYHNGIFAQNSIKLAMRKYEKPSMKSNSEADFATLTAAAVSAAVAAANAATTETSNTSNADAMIGITGADEDDQLGQPTLERSTTDNRKDPLEILENFKEENQQDQINANSSGGSIMTSFHSDNWLFYDKRPTATAISTLPLPEMSAINDNDEGENQPISRNEIAKITVASNDLEFNNDEQNLELNVLDDDEVKKRSVLPTVVTAPISSIPTSVAQSTAAAAAAPFGVDFDECTARSLTSSSCHSERSVIHLNCVVCFEDDSNLNLAGGNIGAAECSLALAAENDDDDEDNTPTNNDIEPCEIDATIVETNNNEARTPTEAIDASSSLAVSVNVSDKNNNKKQINQIKENLKRESYQTFDGLKEDDGVFELVNRHNVSSLLQTTAPTPTVLLAHQSSSSSSSMASNKFVSTCHIEIKPAVKNFVSPNLKLIKVNLNTNNTTTENPSLLISSSNITSSKDDDSRTTTNAQMLSAAPKLKATEERETDKKVTNRLIDDEETTLNEEYTKSLLTPAPAKTTVNNNIDSTSAVLNNENSTSNDETSTLCCKTTAAQPINEISLNAELNQLVEELIESVVENTSSSNNREVKSADIPSQDEDIDLVVREVVNNLLDQIESRLIENREEDDLMSLKNEKSEFDDLKKQMNEDLDNLMREKTCTNLSSSTVKENSPSTNNLNQSIDKENNVIESSAAKESSRDEEKADIDGDQLQEEESQMMDRFNTLITARPFNSINLSSTSRQNHHNNHQNRLKGSNNLQAKTLMSMGNSKSRLSPHNFNNQQSTTAIDSSDILLPSVKYSICNRLKNIANQQQQQQKPLVNTIFANANSTTPTSSTTPFSRSENMPHKDAELVIDYVESAFDKQIKQAKSAINNNNSSNNLTASNSFVFSAAANSITNSTNNMALTKPPSQSANQQQSVQKKPPISSEEPSSSASNEHATSVKERIMLFSTNGPNNTPRIIAGLSPKKPKLLNKILNNDLLSTKLVHNQSSPSIGNPNLPFLKKSTTGVAMSSFVSCSQQYCNVSTLRKYSSTTALQVQPQQQQQVESTQIVEAIPVKSIDEMVVVETSVKNEEEIAVNQSCENSDFAADNLEQFKSVKERIAYFSSKAAAKRAASKKFLTNLNKAKSNSVLNTSDFGTKTTAASETTRFFPFANKIEIVSSNAAAAINRLNLAKYNCNADDYDSLKHAYKLNALANSTNGVNKSGWKVNNMKSPQAKPFVNGSAIKPTNVNGSSTTSTNNVITHASYSSNTHMKLELKNIIYSNENKITDMIENIETKIKA